MMVKYFIARSIITVILILIFQCKYWLIKVIHFLVCVNQTISVEKEDTELSRRILWIGLIKHYRRGGGYRIIKEDAIDLALSNTTVEGVVDVNNLKNGRKPVKLQKESPAGYAGEGKQSKRNWGEVERTV